MVEFIPNEKAGASMSNVLELHENMTQILHVNTQTAKTLRELQKLMHDVHGRF